MTADIPPVVLTHRLRDQGKLAIAVVLNTSATPAAATRFDLEIDLLNVPKRRVSLLQVIEGTQYLSGG